MRAVRRLSTAGLLIAALGGTAPLGVRRQRVDGDTAPATDRHRPEGGFVDVIKVDGLLDPVLVDFIEQSIVQARARRRALVWSCRSNTTGVGRLRRELRAAARPDRRVDGAGRRLGRAERLDSSQDEPARLVGRGRRVRHGAGHRLRQLRARNARRASPVDGRPASAPLIDDTVIAGSRPTSSGSRRVDAPDHRRLHASTCPASRPGGHPGRRAARREPVTQSCVFSQLSLVDPAVPHAWPARRWPTCCWPSGSALIVFELFTAGVGVAGVVGAGAFVLSCYGLAVLPTHWWGIALHRAVDARVRHRRADRRAALLDRRRRGRCSSSARSPSTTACRCRGSPCCVGIVGVAAHVHSPACRPWCAPGSRRRRSAASG